MGKELIRSIMNGENNKQSSFLLTNNICQVRDGKHVNASVVSKARRDGPLRPSFIGKGSEESEKVGMQKGQGNEGQG